MTVSIIAVEDTDLFVGSEDDPKQILRVTIEGPETEIVVSGPGIRGVASGTGVVEVPLVLARQGSHTPGTRVPVTVDAGPAHTTHEVEIAEPGWTMHMVSHFHYDPVWWNTQASYTSPWDLVVEDDGSTRPPFQHNAFALIDLHLDLALRDPVYKFVLAEIDYLKPYFDQHPARRAQLRELMDDGRVELMGGTYNEPSTNLTGAEATIRNIVYGIGYQRDVLGGDPRTAWQLDVFGHDPQFPGLLEAAGITASAWARGPFHQWGPIQKNFGEAKDDARVMQFPSEFEWISPSGRGVLTHYMPHHYSAGWWMDDSADLETAIRAVYELYRKLKPVASTKNLLLPVGTDYTPPNRWLTQIHRTWAQRYTWPRFECALPRDFLDAVRIEAGERGLRPSPQSRDMNPIYTGKDVSFIDTKQAQRACEVAILDAEKLATIASVAGLGGYPSAAMDKAWRQLAYGAHHDAITGSESDQVYLDLLTGWREAYDLATGVRDAALTALLGRIRTGDGDGDGDGGKDGDGDGDEQAADVSIVVFNTLSFDRSGLVAVQVPEGVAGRQSVSVLDDAGAAVPCAVEAGTLRFHAGGVPALGWRSWRLVRGGEAAPIPLWQAADGVTIENARYRVTADPARGGGLSSIYDLRDGRELMVDGEVGNELRVYAEYPQHPDFGEGPWHLVPRGLSGRSADAAAEVRRETGPLGERLVITGRLVAEVDGDGEGDSEGDGEAEAESRSESTAYEQTVTLWREGERVECRTRLLDFAGADRLFRVRFPADLPGALPVCEVADAVIGRGFALPESAVADAPWTLDNPANSWFGLGSTARVDLLGADGVRELGGRALGIAEIVVPTLGEAGDARDLVAALARVGVTATTSAADWARYGWLEVDSNLPDFRIVLGGPEHNPVARALLAGAGSEGGAERELLEKHGRVWIPARTSLREAWRPNADFRDLRALPALVVAAHAREGLVADVADARITAVCAEPPQPGDFLTDHTVALLTRGLPGFAVDPGGALYLSLMRSCTGWPSGGWVDPPRRTLPDGRRFQLQHWTHEFAYALVSGDGDWRASALPAQGREYNHPLYALPTGPGEAGAAETSADNKPGFPSTLSWLRVHPQRKVLLGALKPTGDPIAHGSAAEQNPANGVTMRLVESTGFGHRASLDGALEIDGLVRTDLLEERPIGPALEDRSVCLAGSEISTVTGIPRAASPAAGGTGTAGALAVLGPDREIAQPVFTRYWLHNRGPAPLGFLPVSIGVSPALVRVEPGAGGGEGEPFELTVTLASQLTDAEVTVTAEVVVPEAGWQVTPRTSEHRLAPSGHEVYGVTVTPPAGAEPGVYFIPVRTEFGEQRLEDVVTVAIGAQPSPQDELTVEASLAVGADRIEVVLGNATRSEIHGEIQIAAPYDVWAALASPTRGFSVGPGSTTRLAFDLCFPADTAPGTYWAVPKIMYFGRCRYAASIPLAVGSR